MDLGNDSAGRPSTSAASESGTNCEIDLGLDKKKPKSLIWKHFKLVGDEKEKSAKCNYCNKAIKTSFANTTGARRHLQNKHFSKYLELEKEEKLVKEQKLTKQSSPVFPNLPKGLICSKQSKLSDLDKWQKSNPRSIALTKEVGKWMASSLHPYSLADEVGLRNVLQLAQPKYNLPSSKTFTRRVIPNLFEEVKVRISTLLDEKKSILTSTSITLDLWTSRANSSYLAVTNHFLDEEFVMHNLCLGCYSHSGEHTGQSISGKLLECLTEWGLRDLKIPIYTVTDNANNMKSAMSLSTPFVTPLHCFAHTLQLALRDAKGHTPGMGDLVAKVRKLVGHYKHSTRATERLHKIQKEMGKLELQLIQDCETRWNSEYLMLARFLQNREALSRDLATSGNFDNLTVSEWKLVQGYIDILEPLYQATTEVCSSVLPTCSIVIPILYCIQTKLDAYKDEERGCGKMFAANLLKCLLSRFPNKMKVDPYLTAMLVDPRFKDIVLDEVERNLAHRQLRSHITRITQIETSSQEKSTTAQQTADVGEKKQRSLWDIFNKVAAKRAESSSNALELPDKVDVELKIYFSEPCIKSSEHPCTWWNENKGRFPLLQNVAKQFLAIPATEVASERTFSSAGNVVTELRERLTSEHVEELVFLHQNSKFYM